MSSSLCLDAARRHGTKFRASKGKEYAPEIELMKKEINKWLIENGF